MPTTALIAGGLGLAGSIGGSLIQSNAAQAASAQQSQLGYAGLAQQQQMFNTAKGGLQPYISAGYSAIPQLQQQIQNLNSPLTALYSDIAGFNNPINRLNALTAPGSTALNLQNLPGFNFQSQYGTMATKNALASQGLGASSGPLATAISQYNQGLAGTYYPTYLNADVGALTAQGNLQSQQVSSQLQQVQGLMNQAGLNQSLINSGVSSAGSLAGASINSGNAQAQTLQNIGTAQAQGTLGSANAIAGGLTGGTSSISNALLLNSLLGGQGGLYGGGGSPLQNAILGGSGLNPFIGANT